MQIRRRTLVVTALLLTLTGAQAAISAPASKPAETISTIKVDKTKWPRGITVSSAAIGGVYYAWAAGWQKVLTQKLGLATNVEVTGGSVQNIQLVDEAQSTFGIIGSSHSFEGWNGHDWAKGRKFRNIRLVLPMYSTYIQGVTLEKSGIRKLQDLEGKAVGLGPKGGGGDANVRAMMKVLQIKPKRIVNAGWDDLNDQMKDGLLDAQLTSAGAPQASFAELEVTEKVVFFGVSSEDAKKVIAEYPYYIENVLPPGIYKAVKQPMPTLSGWVMTICHKELPEDFVYTAVKETYANQDMIVAAHPVGKEMPMERAASSPIPVHSGALKYYLEKGIKFPEKTYPPEFKK